MSGNLELVRSLAGRGLLGLGAPAVAVDEPGAVPGPCLARTPLMLAAEYGQLEAARVLIGSRANLGARAELENFGSQQFDARCLALASGSTDLAELLQASGAPVLPCSEDAQLFAAIKEGSLAHLAFQLRAHPNPAAQRAALIRLAGKSQGELVTELVETAVQTGVGLTPVFNAAIEAGDLDLVERLALGGATLAGSTQLARAVGLGRVAMIRPLVSAGASAELPPDAILAAIKSHQGPTLSALLAAGWRGNDDTPVLLWAMRHFPQYVEILIAGGVGVEVDDVEGTTPLIFATLKDNRPWIARLLARGAAPQTADATCRSALSIATANGNPELMLISTTRFSAPVPGRAAQRLHVGCGSAIVRVQFDVGVEVFLDGSLASLTSSVAYHAEPGPHALRIARTSGREIMRTDVELHSGLNELTATAAEDRPAEVRVQPRAPGNGPQRWPPLLFKY